MYGSVKRISVEFLANVGKPTGDSQASQEFSFPPTDMKRNADTIFGTLPVVWLS